MVFESWSQAIKVPDNLHLNLVTIAAVFFGVYLAYLLYYGLFLCPTRHIPGPFLTRFSYAPYYFLLFRGRGCMETLSLHQKYGPVVRLAPDMIDARSVDVAQQAWAGIHPLLPWDKDPDFCRMVRAGMSVDNVLSTQRFKDAMRLRRLIGTPFARKFLHDQEQIFKDCTNKMLDLLEEERLREGRVDVLTHFMKYSFDLLTEFAYGGYFKGARIRPGVSEIELISQVPLGNVFSGLFPTLFKIMQHIPWRKFDWTRSRDEFIQVCDISIREYKANVKDGSRRDSLSTLIAAREEDGTGLSHDELVGMASVFLVAGVDTTAMTLVYFSYLVAQNPKWFDRLADELSGHGYTNVNSLQSADLEKLPLLNATIRETLRLYPPAASPIFARVVPEGGTTLAGHQIPAGVKVSRAAWTICRDPEIYPDPDAFVPERWLNLSREEETLLWDQTMIFSYGPRVCLGKEMALMELRMLAAALVMKYTWTGVPDKAGNWDREMWPFDTSVLHPTGGKCVLRLEQRV